MENEVVVANEGEELFPRLPSLTYIEVKKSAVAAELSALIAYKGVTRAQVAQRLCWAKSRVTKFLSGDANLTLAKLAEFTAALECDFDIVFRDRLAPRASQCWNAFSDVCSLPAPRAVAIHVQTPAEVFADFSRGLAKEVYVSALGYPGQPETFWFSSEEARIVGPDNLVQISASDNSKRDLTYFVYKEEKKCLIQN